MAVYQSLTLTQLSQDIPQNTSRIRVLWQSVQTGGSYNNVTHTANLWVNVNGTQLHADAVSYTLPYGQTAVLYDREITVPHNEMGQAEVTAGTWMDTHISAGVVELRKSISLPQIPRATTLTAPDTVIGYVCRVALSPKYPGARHSLFYEFAGLSGYLNEDGEHSDEEVIFGGNSVPFTLPLSFHQQIPDRRQAPCKLTCRTYADGSLLGQPQTAEFTASIDEASCWPAVSGTVRDVNEATLALTGSDRVLIQGYSHGKCTLVYDTFWDATPQQLRINDVLLAEGQDSLVIQQIRQLPTVSITDSRGLVDQYTLPATLIPYETPTCKASLTRLHPTDGTARLQVEGRWYSEPLGLSDNSLQVQYRVGDGDWQSPPLSVDGGSYTAECTLTDMAYDRVYTVTVLVSDRLSQVEKRVILKKSTPVFDWGEADFHFHVPVTVDGTLTVKGKPLADFLYPVGSVYISTQSQEPAQLFGGVWEPIRGRFLLGADSQYPAGSQGGEESHVLTASELPAHSHAAYGWAYTNAAGGSIALGGNGQAENYRTRDTGENQAHNNMPPYLAVYMWKRVS